MKNELESYIKDNKRSFESAGPSEQLWSKIAKSLDEQKKPAKKTRLYSWVSIAAMLLISTGIYITVRVNGNAGTIAIADVNPSYAKKEVHFAALIEEKKDSLQNYSTQNPELYQQFTNDISKLDADYEELKKQLQTSPNREAVVRAMMKNLEIRANILSQQLNIINQVNQYKKENTI